MRSHDKFTPRGIFAPRGKFAHRGKLMHINGALVKTFFYIFPIWTVIVLLCRLFLMIKLLGKISATDILSCFLCSRHFQWVGLEGVGGI